MVDTVAGTKVAVSSVYVLRERGQLAVRVDGFTWDFPTYGPVELQAGAETIRARYVAFANVDGAPVLYLEPDDPRYVTVAQIATALGAPDAHGLFRPEASCVRRAV